MRKSKKEWVDQFREVIREIKENSFSSHDFIGKFCKMYEPEWKQLLERYETGANQKVNAYIARMLSSCANDLPIRKLKELKPSKNIHASTSRVHWWEKTN